MDPSNPCGRRCPTSSLTVAWVRDFRIDTDSRRKFQQVNYQDVRHMEARLQHPSPLVFALADVKDYAVLPHSVKAFQGVYEGALTGRTFSGRSLEVEVLRRLTAD